MSPPVFFGAGAVVLGFCLFGGLFTETAAALFSRLEADITARAGWYYLLLVSGALLFALAIAFSGKGHERIGGADARPEFSRLSWFAMLFTAGMGIGLVFWAVAEPLTHYAEPLSAEAMSPAARREAMRLTFFHWGLHPWGIYAVLGLAIALAHFNDDLPLAPRSLLYPFIGERIYGPIGHVTDILATVGTLLGVSTSLGLGAQQIAAGLERLSGLAASLTVELSLIAIITAAATCSVAIGVEGGIRRLARANGLIAVGLFLFILIAGPTIVLLETFVSTLGGYLQNLPRMSLYAEPGGTGGWQADWTFFYWGWWISWAPFVAVFVARVSKGRTVREFVLTVLFLPSLVTMLWLAVFGGTALSYQTGGEVSLIDTAQDTPAVSLHALLEAFPFTTAAQAMATVLIVIFFITSSDSGSLVDDIVTSGGRLDPPRWQRIFWATSEGVTAIVLLLVGGLEALRSAAISMGLPMSALILVAMAFLLRRREASSPR